MSELLRTSIALGDRRASFRAMRRQIAHESPGRFQVGKAPAESSAFFQNRSEPVSRLNVPRLVKIHDPAAQPDIQPPVSQGKLNDERIFALDGCCLSARNLTGHIAFGSLLRTAGEVTI